MSEFDWNALRQIGEDATRALPVGKYRVIVTKAEAVKASTGADMIKATFEVMEGQFKGRNLFNNFVLSTEKPFALAMFFKNLAAFGLDGNFFAQNPGNLDAVAANLVNKQAVVGVKIEPFQGLDRNQVESCEPVTGGIGLSSGPSLSVPSIPAGVPSIPQAGTPVPSAREQAAGAPQPVIPQQTQPLSQPPSF